MPSSYTCLRYHLIWSTKFRQSTIMEEFRERLVEYMGGILRGHRGRLLAAGGMPDHVHLLTDINKQQAVADAVRDIKASSSGWIHQMFPAHRSFAWQTGYGAFTVSQSNVDQVKRYIDNQAEHHRTQSFQEEFVGFLQKHDVAYDEQYLWE